MKTFTLKSLYFPKWCPIFDNQSINRIHWKKTVIYFYAKIQLILGVGSWNSISKTALVDNEFLIFKIISASLAYLHCFIWYKSIISCLVPSYYRNIRVSISEVTGINSRKLHKTKREGIWSWCETIPNLPPFRNHCRKCTLILILIPIWIWFT